MGGTRKGVNKTTQAEQLQELEQRRQFCGFYLLRSVAEKMAATCCKGGGPVIALENLPHHDEFTWAMGLYSALLDAAEQYIGCTEGEKPGICAVMCQRCREENEEHPAPICTGQKACIRF